MGQRLRLVLVCSFGVLLFAGTAAASLVALNAECNGSDSECPRSAAYRGVVLANPVVALVVLLCGAVWAVRRRTVRPLVLAEACVLAVSALGDAVINSADIGTLVLLAGAAALGRAALRRPEPPVEH